NHDGALDGNPVWQPSAGHLGGTLQCDGDDRVSAGSFDITGSALTISVWVRMTSIAGDADEARYVSKASSTSENDHYWMLGNYLNGTAARFRLKTSSGGTATLVSGEGVLSLNMWHHVAAIYDGTNMYIFADGAKVAETPRSGSLSTSGSIGVALGNQPDGAGSRGLIGQLDDVRLYNRALPQEELQILTNLSPFDDWAMNSITNPAARGAWDDPDSDGIANFMERAFALDPQTPGTGNLPRLDVTTGYLSLVYQRDINAGDLAFTPEVTGDLVTGNWQSDAQHVTETVLSVSNNVQFLRASSSTPMAHLTHQFLRIRVTTP
ncbi:LamG domain-containing protein, partial [Verrucomicrobiota bacterium]